MLNLAEYYGMTFQLVKRVKYSANEIIKWKYHFKYMHELAVCQVKNLIV